MFGVVLSNPVSLSMILRLFPSPPPPPPPPWSSADDPLPHHLLCLQFHGSVVEFLLLLCTPARLGYELQTTQDCAILCASQWQTGPLIIYYRRYYRQHNVTYVRSLCLRQLCEHASSFAHLSLEDCGVHNGLPLIVPLSPAVAIIVG